MSEGAGSTWSMVDGKPETNSSTACISGVFDVNGAQGPNKLGIDVRTLNSLYGSVDLGTSYTKLPQSDCPGLKKKLGIKNCRTDGQDDYWGGAVKACHDLHLHLPSMTTLATAAGSMFGTSDLGIYDRINYPDQAGEQNHGVNYTLAKDSNASVYLGGHFWSSSEGPTTYAWTRRFISSSNYVYRNRRHDHLIAFCVGD